MSTVCGTCDGKQVEIIWDSEKQCYVSRTCWTCQGRGTV